MVSLTCLYCLSDRSPMSPKPPTPDVKNVHSKIGSLDNARHSPGGGNVSILHKLTYSPIFCFDRERSNL